MYLIMYRHCRRNHNGKKTGSDRGNLRRCSKTISYRNAERKEKLLFTHCRVNQAVFGENRRIILPIKKSIVSLPRFSGKSIIMIVSWCNGSTAVFGSACLGSNPGETTINRNTICFVAVFPFLGDKYRYKLF